MLIDTHAHLNFQAYDQDLAEVIQRCHQAEMKIINVGAALDTSQKAIELAKQENNFYAAIALHPIHVYDEEFEIINYQKLIDQHPKQVVAIGETGLDYFHLNEILKKGAASIKEIKIKQKQIFQEHIQLAKDNNFALIVHGRNGDDQNVYQDIFNILENNKYFKGVIHCYGGSLAEAKQFVQAGFYLGFTGVITFGPPSRKASEDQLIKKKKVVDKTEDLREIVKWMPLDKILIETDAPYLTPVPFRGKRNEPVNVKYVAEKIAEIKNKSVQEIIEITGQNAIKLFNLK